MSKRSKLGEFANSVPTFVPAPEPVTIPVEQSVIEEEVVVEPVQEPVVEPEHIEITPQTLESTGAFKRAKPCQRCFAEPTFSLSDGGELRISCDKCHTYAYGNSIEQALAHWNEK